MGAMSAVPARAARRTSASCSSRFHARGTSRVGFSSHSGSSPSRVLASDHGESARGSPSKPLASCVVAIRGQPFTTGLDGQSRRPRRVRRGFRHLAVLAQGLDHRPLPLAGQNDRSVGLYGDDATRLDSVIQGSGTGRHPPMGADAHDAGEHLRCHAGRPLAH